MRRVEPLVAAGLFIASWSALGSSAFAQPQPGCTRSLPQFGWLHLDRPVRVTVHRRGSALSRGTGAPICVGDRIPPSGVSGRVTSGDDSIGILPDRPTLIPRRESILLRWLGIPSRRDWLYRLTRPAGVAMSVRPGFTLEGVRSGTAVLAVPRRTLVIPVNPLPFEQNVQLLAPGEETPRIVRVGPGESEARFAGLPARTGRWRVAIRGANGDMIPGAFEVSGRPLRDEASRTLEALDLSPRDRLLARACLDPRTNALESYQDLPNEGGRDLLIEWETPGPDEQLSCATPAAEPSTR